MNCTIGGSVIFTDAHDCRCLVGQECKDGLILPKWDFASDGEASFGNIAKLGCALIYFFALLYMFLGVSVVADRFMAAIETITSQERKITVKNKNGQKVTVTIRIWNETVSNLTLMALGSSAPEILLSIIEVCGNDFKAGDLGPNTIIGSAAFNLFIIIAICIYAIPNGQIRRQQHLRVFLVTATWSVFAYIWLYFILSVFSPGVVKIWEALMTFIFFPVTVLSAYVADRRLFDYGYLRKSYRARQGSMFTHAMRESSAAQVGLVEVAESDMKLNAILEDHKRSRCEFGAILKRLKSENPTADLTTLQRDAEYEMIQSARKSRAFYRIQTNKQMTGGGNVIRRNLHKIMASTTKAPSSQPGTPRSERKAPVLRIFFNPPYYTVLENVGFLDLTVTLDGKVPEGFRLVVDYYTVDGTANAGSDYVENEGSLTFESTSHFYDSIGKEDAKSKEKWFQHAQIRIQILDDDVFEEDEHFFVELTNARLEKVEDKIGTHIVSGGTDVISKYRIEISEPQSATIVVLDDDHPGVFLIEHEDYTVHENCGSVNVKVIRKTGSRGRVLVPYKTVSGTARENKDFEAKDSFLLFEDEELEKTITIGIMNDEEYEKMETFTIELEEPIWIEKCRNAEKIIEQYRGRDARPSIVTDIIRSLSHSEPIEEPVIVANEVEMIGMPRLGQIKCCLVKIVESSEFKHLVDEVAEKTKIASVVGTSTWREQFVDALTLSVAEEGEGLESVPAKPKCSDYVMHAIALPWKLLGACCPPTEILSGWCCFLVSIILIGIFTAIIGDLANHFGCSIGLKDSVTAISFVAMGTSVPDLFASKLAAIQDKYSDSSIGNVTGSNAVNVFLGIGIAWSLCAVVSYLRHEPNGFQVEPGTLAFSVTIFCSMAVVAIGLLLARRRWRFLGGGELGGHWSAKVASSALLISMWLTYLILCSLEAYCIIPGF